MPAPGPLQVFAIGGSRAWGERLAAALGVALAAHEERAFEDGEHKIRPLDPVAGRDALVVHALHAEPGQSPNDKLCRMLFLAGALKDAGAARVTAIAPYLCYARKDRRTQPQDPVATRYVARMMEAVAIDRVLTVDVHNLAAFENAFRIPTLHVEARPLLAGHAVRLLAGEPVAVVSPDIGGAKRAEAFRLALAARTGREPGAAFVDKRRSGGQVSGHGLVGEVAGRTALLVDDLIGTGTTLARAAEACRAAGAARVIALAAHGLFTGEAAATLAAAPIERIAVTDTVPPFRLAGTALAARLDVLDAAPLVARALG